MIESISARRRQMASYCVSADWFLLSTQLHRVTLDLTLDKLILQEAVRRNF